MAIPHHTTESVLQGKLFLFCFSLVLDTPVRLQHRWGDETFSYLTDLYHSMEAPDAGISLVGGYMMLKTESDVPFWANTVFGFRPMTSKELKQYPGNKDGFYFLTYMCESVYYLPWLTKKFIAKGGKILQKKINDLSEVSSSADIIVNCSGVGARYLSNDKEVEPLKGHLLRVEAPWLKHFIISDAHTTGSRSNHLLPGRDFVAVGGFEREGDWSLNPEPEDSKWILEGAQKLVPTASSMGRLRRFNVDCDQGGSLSDWKLSGSSKGVDLSLLYIIMGMVEVV